jgi:hypothetical protein
MTHAINVSGYIALVQRLAPPPDLQQHRPSITKQCSRRV